MYHVRIAELEDIYKIVDMGFTFDLNINYNPKFYILLKDEEFLSFAFVNFEDKINIIEYINIENLNFDEIDFFIKSLDYLLESNNNKNYMKQYIENYTGKIKYKDLYPVEIKFMGCGK